jgi:hypothetical protein
MVHYSSIQILSISETLVSNSEYLRNPYKLKIYLDAKIKYKLR